MTVVPAVLVLIVGSELISQNLERWFNAPMDEILSSANQIASDYYQQRQAVLSLVEAMHREKNISKDIIFGGIEQAIQLAIERASMEEVDVLVHIDRQTGGVCGGRGWEACIIHRVRRRGR